MDVAATIADKRFAWSEQTWLALLAARNADDRYRLVQAVSQRSCEVGTRRFCGLDAGL